MRLWPTLNHSCCFKNGAIAFTYTKALLMQTNDALTQETIFGVADSVTYSGMLCLAPDGRRYFYAHAQVDGRTLPLPHDHWTSRDAAVRGLAAIASGESKPAVA